MKRFPGSWPLLAIIAAASCKKPYSPAVLNSPNSYLVVEGVISGSTDGTTINLSRTVNLSNKITANPVTHATVAVQSDQNSVYPLTESSPGTYTSGSFTLDNASKYRLRIVTQDGKIYSSDYVNVVNSPPIDSLNFTVQSDGIKIYSNTHDARNNTHYYRWAFQETWIIFSNYESFFKSNGDTVLLRSLDDQIYQCWETDTSTSIVLNSSAKLTQDVITNNLVTSITSTSEKLGTKYSILVTQYGLSPDAYKFWTNLKTITEKLGSVFDAQPSEIIGNVHNSADPDEPVIGFISAGNAASARIFISAQQLPHWTPTPAYPSCTLDSFYYKNMAPGGKNPGNEVDLYINYKKGAFDPEIPVRAISRPGAPPMGYSASSRICVDCTLRGTNVAPSFWK